MLPVTPRGQSTHNTRGDIWGFCKVDSILKRFPYLLPQELCGCSDEVPLVVLCLGIIQIWTHSEDRFWGSVEISQCIQWIVSTAKNKIGWSSLKILFSIFFLFLLSVFFSLCNFCFSFRLLLPPIIIEVCNSFPWYFQQLCSWNSFLKFLNPTALPDFKYHHENAQAHW